MFAEQQSLRADQHVLLSNQNDLYRILVQHVESSTDMMQTFRDQSSIAAAAQYEANEMFRHNCAAVQQMVETINAQELRNGTSGTGLTSTAKFITPRPDKMILALMELVKNTRFNPNLDPHSQIDDLIIKSGLPQPYQNLIQKGFRSYAAYACQSNIFDAEFDSDIKKWRNNNRDFATRSNTIGSPPGFVFVPDLSPEPIQIGSYFLDILNHKQVEIVRQMELDEQLRGQPIVSEALRSRPKLAPCFNVNGPLFNASASMNLQYLLQLVYLTFDAFALFLRQETTTKNGSTISKSQLNCYDSIMKLKNKNLGISLLATFFLVLFVCYLNFGIAPSTQKRRILSTSYASSCILLRYSNATQVTH